MKQLLIKAYYELVQESTTLSGKELIENRERRKRMNKRSVEQYGMFVSSL